MIYHQSSLNPSSTFQMAHKIIHVWEGATFCLTYGYVSSTSSGSHNFLPQSRNLVAPICKVAFLPISWFDTDPNLVVITQNFIFEPLLRLEIERY